MEFLKLTIGINLFHLRTVPFVSYFKIITLKLCIFISVNRMVFFTIIKFFKVNISS